MNEFDPEIYSDLLKFMPKLHKSCSQTQIFLNDIPELWCNSINFWVKFILMVELKLSLKPYLVGKEKCRNQNPALYYFHTIEPRAKPSAALNGFDFIDLP